MALSLVSAAGTLALTASDVRQYVYCTRIPYYRLGARLPYRFVTGAMQEGVLEHQRVADLEHRRTLRTYGLAAGDRHFDVAMRSESLALAGRMDLVIQLPHEVIPVEFKNSRGPIGLHHKYQLTAYALLAEAHFQLPVRRAFAYFIPLKEAQSVPITPATRAYTRRVLASIRSDVAREHVPDGTRVLARCTVCEFLPYCNDRW